MEAERGSERRTVNPESKGNVHGLIEGLAHDGRGFRQRAHLLPRRFRGRHHSPPNRWRAAWREIRKASPTSAHVAPDSRAWRTPAVSLSPSSWRLRSALRMRTRSCPRCTSRSSRLSAAGSGAASIEAGASSSDHRSTSGPTAGPWPSQAGSSNHTPSEENLRPLPGSPLPLRRRSAFPRLALPMTPSIRPNPDPRHMKPCLDTLSTPKPQVSRPTHAGHPDPCQLCPSSTETP